MLTPAEQLGLAGAVLDARVRQAVNYIPDSTLVHVARRLAEDARFNEVIYARDGVNALVSLARQAPELAHRTERLSREIDEMAEHGLRFDEDTARAIGRAEARATRWGRVALWVIALALVWIAFELA